MTILNKKSLKEIAKQRNVDKYIRHSYIDIYERILKPVRHLSFTFFEIGIEQGKSIEMWREYLFHATICAIDKRKECIRNFGSRVKTFVMDQTNTRELIKLGEHFGTFDFIVDDGSHRSFDQVFSFNILFNLLSNGGYYFIEDTHTSFIEQFSRSKYNGMTCFEYFVDIVESMNKKGGCKISNVEFVLFYERMIVIKKK